MKHYLLILIVIFFASTMVKAQLVTPATTNKQAKVAMKSDQKKGKERGKRAGVAKQKTEDRVETKPRYKK